MNKRLVWNFEIPSGNQLQLPEPSLDITADTHWESRFFWPEKSVIVLSGLDEYFLELSRYKIKHRLDYYTLLPDTDDNIKKRKDEWVYKPLLKQTTLAVEYGKKIKLKDDSEFKDQGQTVLVEKEALIYKFESHPSTKLELARLVINQQVFFTLCIEAPELSWVEQLTQQITDETLSLDYVSFLKQQVGLS